MIITIVLSVLVAFLVPSPALMEESAALITGYGACLGVAVLLACLMMRAGSRQKGAGLPALCIVLGLTGARLFYCLVRIQYYVNEVGIQHIFFLREGGMIIARNIPYSTIPIAEDTASGSTSPADAPRNVPSTQPAMAMSIMPYIYAGTITPFCAEQTANISSVMPYEASRRCGVVKLLSSFCDSDSAMSE